MNTVKTLIVSFTTRLIWTALQLALTLLDGIAHRRSADSPTLRDSVASLYETDRAY